MHASQEPVERRAGRRYPLDAVVYYQIIANGMPIQAGQGKAISISNSGLMFSPAAGTDDVAAGRELKILILWPAPARSDRVIQFSACGRVVRADDHCWIICFQESDFRPCLPVFHNAATPISRGRVA